MKTRLPLLNIDALARVAAHSALIVGSLAWGLVELVALQRSRYLAWRLRQQTVHHP